MYVYLTAQIQVHKPIDHNRQSIFSSLDFTIDSFTFKPWSKLKVHNLEEAQGVTSLNFSRVMNRLTDSARINEDIKNSRIGLLILRKSLQLNLIYFESPHNLMLL